MRLPQLPLQRRSRRPPPRQRQPPCSECRGGAALLSTLCVAISIIYGPNGCDDDKLNDSLCW